MQLVRLQSGIQSLRNKKFGSFAQIRGGAKIAVNFLNFPSSIFVRLKAGKIGFNRVLIFMFENKKFC
jgi:hypothetical protein